MVPCHDRPRHDASTGRRSSGPAALELCLRLPADWLSPSIGRRRLQDWLAAHKWPAEHADDVVLAVSEALSNSIEHGYGVPRDGVGHPGSVEVSARIVAGSGAVRRVETTVRDDGRWRPPPDAGAHRRNGIPLMRAIMDTVGIEGTEQGTTVVLLSRPVAVPAPRG
ncbi:MAG TPA: ATP-binding protein [Pseudonocardia sp.]|nr:ATP-binding protein [Pseudonocardia sp.]